MRGVIAVGVLVLFLAVPAVQAQSPVSKVTLNVPAGPMHMKAPGEHPMTMSVGLKLENIVCSSAAEATVTLKEASAPMDGVMLHLGSTSVKFPIPQGAYQNMTPQGPKPYSTTLEATFMVMLDESAPEDHGHSFKIQADFVAGTPTNCQASTTVPGSSTSGEHAIHIMPRPLGANATSDAATAGGNLNADAGSPMPGFLVILGACAMALALRRLGTR